MDELEEHFSGVQCFIHEHTRKHVGPNALHPDPDRLDHSSHTMRICRRAKQRFGQGKRHTHHLLAGRHKPHLATRGCGGLDVASERRACAAENVRQRIVLVAREGVKVHSGQPPRPFALHNQADKGTDSHQPRPNTDTHTETRHTHREKETDRQTHTHTHAHAQTHAHKHADNIVICTCSKTPAKASMNSGALAGRFPMT